MSSTELGLPLTPQQVAGKIDVNNPLDTVNLEICATDPNPELAQRIAATTADQFQAYVAEFEVPDTTTGQALVKIRGSSRRRRCRRRRSRRAPKSTSRLGFLVGLAIGVGAAVLLETLDTRIKSIEVLAKHFDQTLLGVIGYDPEAPKKPLIVQDSPQSKRAESFRQVRTNLQFVDIDHRPKSIVVTSSIPREGKSTTAINLAITIAQTGQPVFLIEGDLRRPKIADYLGIEGNAGLTDVLVGRATIDEVMQPWGTTGNLWVLPAGRCRPNPSELLGSQSMADLVHHLEKRATLIIDAPPLLPVTDAAVLSQLAGGAIIIIATGKTRREQLRTAVQQHRGRRRQDSRPRHEHGTAKGPDSHRYGYGYPYDYKTVDDARQARRPRAGDSGGSGWACPESTARKPPSCRLARCKPRRALPDQTRQAAMATDKARHGSSREHAIHPVRSGSQTTAPSAPPPPPAPTADVARPPWRPRRTVKPPRKRKSDSMSPPRARTQ